MLTSEIPFLDKYEALTTSRLDSGYATSTEIDMTLLSDYCRDSQPFPTESLLTNKASEYAIDFVKSMMFADPRRRVSAAGALNSRWLRGTESSPVIVSPPVIGFASQPLVILTLSLIFFSFSVYY